ncbi:MAG: NADP-dependent glyceraldehyde-3-phosphate dehydrogenase [Leptonema illini]|uniref:NADP-dependent glyceraldehyde-3-phosphate dehydrogenase n=1 Tax=Leptonema illini TaxID=183 RepID=A0A833H0N9_9LEPT|nr:MAG: NADP-dependent glyceraldehyde-3-phosphate dehydrogenase [Leptonema illini]
MAENSALLKYFPTELPVDVAPGLPSQQRRYLIDGRIEEWKGPMIDVYSPVCVQKDNSVEPVYLGSAPAMDEETAMRALDAAARAWDRGNGLWPRLSAEQRIQAVHAFTKRMEERREEIVRWIVFEIGKPRSEAEKEFDRTTEYIRDTLNAVKEGARSTARFTVEQGILAQIRRAPLGVVLCMGPFNYPLNETFATFIPALVMGNTVLFKPPKNGILLYGPLLEAMAECFPPGVVNTVYGDGPVVIPPVMRSGKVDVLAFIGSSRVADQLKKEHPHPHKLRAILGMGAKNAAILLPDVKIESVIDECLRGALSYNGQRCTALKIFFVPRDKGEQFVEAFREKMASLAVGMPYLDGVQITPLPIEGKSQYLQGLVDDAVSQGAVAYGGGYLGPLFLPAILYPVKKGMKAYEEEQFGPVVPVVPYDDPEEALDWIVESHYGQQASLFGEDPAQVAHFVDELVHQVCRVNLNSQCQRGPDVFPFTGRKGSAEGTLSVSDALRAFSIRTLVAAKENDANRALLRKITEERLSSFISTDFLF